jgi:hypothetical protein
MCKGADASVAAQSIADGVEDFQVTYGVQTEVAGTVAAVPILSLTR